MKRSRETYEAVLTEKARIFQQVYGEFRRRYETALKLAPLMAAWGGRPDYSIGQRCFEDGLPLVVWIFSDKDAFRDYHKNVKHEDLPEGVAGYFSPKKGWVFLYDEGEDRQLEIDKNVHEGVHQLQYWFSRQRNGWVDPHITQSFLTEGLAEWIGAVRLSRGGALTFQDVNPHRLKTIQAFKRAFQDARIDYLFFPLHEFTTFCSYRDAAMWGVENWKLPPEAVLELYYQQSWAFVYFLNEYRNGKYARRFSQYLEYVFSLEACTSDSSAFGDAFGLDSLGHWERLEREFMSYFTGVILQMDPGDYLYTPPSRPR